MKKNLKKIMTTLRSLKPYLRKTYSIKEIEVFGSFVRDEQKSRSDLDLLVTYTSEPGLIDFLKLENDLSDKLGVQVDLVMKDSLKSELKHYILSEAVSV